jgi:hypothetical protein
LTHFGSKDFSFDRSFTVFQLFRLGCKVTNAEDRVPRGAIGPECLWIAGIIQAR